MNKPSRSLKGPQFVAYLEPVLAALRALGGSARPAEVRQKIVVSLGISEEKQKEALPSGSSRFENQVAWARFYLSRAGMIDSSSRGVWTLTEKGRHARPLSATDALALFKSIHAEIELSVEANPSEGAEARPAVLEGAAPGPESNHRQHVLEILRGLPSAGFERFCQRLLRESGFQEVTVTGKSGDGGIDGIGILQINPLVSFKVLFQCKRYHGENVVASPQVRDFRGAMQGRTDHGIILTTSSFTTDARKEAVREGVPAIELVDGEKLVDMLERLELGLEPVRSYRVREEFFDEFKS